MTMEIKIDDRYLSAENKKDLIHWQSKGLEAFQKLRQKKEQHGQDVGWLDWPSEGGFSLLDELDETLRTIPVFYDLVLVIGIGGSYAGYRGLYELFRHSFDDHVRPSQPKKKMLSIGHNLSEKMLIELLETLDGYKPICLVISKSGTTAETTLAYSLVDRYLINRFGMQEAKERTLLVTDKEKGVLSELSNKYKHITFQVPSTIGGRYSVLTAVGMLPLMLSGFHTRRLMEGADAFFSSIQENSISETNPMIQYAALRRLLWEEGKRIEFLVYNEPSMAMFVEWWKQLFCESEGKNDKGLFPTGALFSTDLHSLGQYLQEGFPGCFETFLLFDEYPQASTQKVETRLRAHVSESFPTLKHFQGRFFHDINQAAMQAACAAHGERGTPCYVLKLPKCNEFYIGYLIAFFQTTCAVSSMLLGVNPFNQPGVEDYKKKLHLSMQAHP